MSQDLYVKRLVDKAKTYDTEAFGELYNLYYDKIFAYVYYKIGNRLEAEDIAEQVFLRALENIASFEWKGVPFSAWLFRIASNLVIDYYRSCRTEFVDIDGEISLESEPRTNPEQSTLRELERQEVISAIKQLTEDQQQVVLLRFILGMSNEEVATVINKNVGAVKALQHRALAALGRILGKARYEI